MDQLLATETNIIQLELFLQGALFNVQSVCITFGDSYDLATDL